MDVALVLAGVALAALAVGVLAALGRTPARVGPGRPLAVAALLAAVAVLFTVLARTPVLPGVDLPVLAAVVAARAGPLTLLAQALSLGGGTVPTAAAGLLAALVLARAGRRRAAVVLALTVVTGSVVIRVAKLAGERPRPPVATRLGVETTASLPSGHALMAATGLGLVAVVALGVPRTATGRRVGGAVTAAALVLAVAIGSSRVYLGVHWASDVLAGWMLGAALVLAATVVVAALEPGGAVPRAPLGRPVDDPANDITDSDISRS